MPDFSADDYFSRRSTQDLPTPAGFDGTPAVSESKFDRLMAASAEKSAVMAGIAASKQLAINSWTTKLGLDRDSIAGEAVNIGAAFGIGTGRMAGDIAEMPVDFNTWQAESGLSEPEIQSLNRYHKDQANPQDAPTATAEDLARINTQHTIIKGQEAPTPLDLYNKAVSNRQRTKNINDTLDFTDTLDPTNRNALLADLGKDFQGAWDQTKQGWDENWDNLGQVTNLGIGGAKLVGNALKAAVTHPAASAEYVAENALPLIVGGLRAGGVGIGKALLGASNAGYASENYQHGMEKERLENDGAMPAEDVRRKMFLSALGAGAAEHFSDSRMLQGFKVPINPGATRRSVKDSILGVAKEVRGSTVREATTEGIQTYLEGEASLTPSTPLEVYQGTAIGGIVGGALSGGGRTVSELTQSTPEHGEIRAQKVERSVALKEAATSGDISKYTDPESSTYAPATAIRALFGNSKSADTPLEAKQENVVKGAKIVSDLEAEFAAVTAISEGGKPQDVIKLEATLAQTKEAITAADPADTARMEMLTGMVPTLETMIAEGSTPQAIASASKAAATKLPALKTQLDLVKSHQKELAGVAQAADVAGQVSSHIADIEAVTGTNDTVEITTRAVAAASKLVILSMASNSNISPEVANSLASNMSNGLSTQQRDYFRKFSAARVSENKLMSSKGVDQEIFVGNAAKKQLGIVSYRDSISNAVTLGDSNKANASLAMLSRFADDHSSKYTTAADAMQESKDSNSIVQIQSVKGENGAANSWKIGTVNLTGEAKAANGALDISSKEGKGNSVGLIGRMKRASGALNDAVAEQSAIIALSFPTNTSNLTTNSNNPAALPASSTPKVVPVVPASTVTATPLPAATLRPNVGEEKFDRALAYVATQDKGSVTPEQIGKATKLTIKAAAYFLTWMEKDGHVSAMDKKGKRTVHFVHPTSSTPDPLLSIDKMREGEERVNGTKVPSPVPTVKNNPTLPRITIGTNPTGFANQMAQLNRDWSDRLGTTQSIEDLFAEGYTAAEVISKLDSKLAPVPKADRSGFIIGVRATLGIPSKMDADGTAAFPKWKAEYDARKAAAAKLAQKPTVTPSKQEAAERQAVASAEGAVAEAAQTGNKNTEEASSTISATTQSPASVAVQSATPPLTTQQTPVVSEPILVHPEGILNIYSQKLRNLVGSMQDNFTSMNLVAQFMTQEKENPLLLTQRPLATVKNFLSAWVANKKVVQAFVEDGENLSEGQEAALNNLKENLLLWDGMFKDNFDLLDIAPGSNAANYKQKDMLQYLLEKDGSGVVDVEENVRTAMAYAMYHFILNKANSPAFLTLEQINKMHSKGKSGGITKEGVEDLRTITSFESMVISELGEIAFQALGFRADADKNTPVDLAPRLKSAMGTHAMLLLEKEGFIRRRSVLATTVNAYFEDSADDFNNEDTNEENADEPSAVPNTKSTYKYIELIREAKSALPAATAMIRASNVDSHSVVEKLFGVDRAPRMASTKPAKFVQKMVKNGRMAITAMQDAVMDTIQQIPHKVIPEMDRIDSLMGRDEILRIAGWIDLADGTTHAVNIAAVEAQNQNLENQYDAKEEMLRETGSKEGRDTERYVLRSVWKNFRAGYLNSSLNMQTSKIHRYLFSRPNWEATISLNDQAMVDEFLIAVAMNLGIKTDTQLNVKTHKKFDAALTSNPKIMEAVRLVQRQLDSTNISPEAMTSKEKETIRNVSINGEGMASLQALVAYAKYQDALAVRDALAAEKKDSSKVDFTVTLLVGADGKTSGPMLTHLALGAAGNLKDLFVLMNRGGFYSTAEGQAQHFSEYSERATSADMYRDFSSKAMTEADSRVRTPAQLAELKRLAMLTVKGTPAYGKAWGLYNSHFTRGQFDAVQAVTGELLTKQGIVTGAGRDQVKEPITMFMFGSALTSSISGMTDKFMERIYTVLEDMAKGKRKKDDLSLNDYLEQLQVLVDLGSTDKFPAGKLSRQFYTEPLKATLTTNQVKALRKAFVQVLGKSASDTMKIYFAVFIERRNQLNAAFQAGYYVYEAAYAAAKTQEVNRLMKTGEIAHRVKAKKAITDPDVWEPLHDLTVAQEDKLREQLKAILPVSHSAFSVQEGNLDAGIFMAKTTNGTSDSPLHENVVNTREGMKFINNAGKEALSYKLHSKSTVQTPVDIGVAGLPNSMHSDDAAGMFNGVAKVPEAQAQDIHDEASTSPVHIAKVAGALNEEILLTALKFSPTREALNMLERQAVGLVRLMKSGALPKSAVRATLESWLDVMTRMDPSNEFTADTVGEALMRMSASNAFAADTLRLQAVAQMGSVDQYTWEGGQFTVTDEIRAEATKQLEALVEEPSQAFQDAVAYMNVALQGQQKSEAIVYADWVGLNTYKENTPTVKQTEITQTSRLGQNARIAKELVMSLIDQMPKALAPLMKTRGSVIDIINGLRPKDRSQAIQVLATAFSHIATSTLTPYGTLGDSSVTHDNNMVTLLEANPVMDAKQIIGMLKGALYASDAPATAENKMYKTLLAQVIPMIPKNMILRYITPTTSNFDLLGVPIENSRGWYVMDPEANSGKGAAEMYILSTDHTNSAVSPEVVLHELLHAVLSQIVNSEIAKRDANPKHTSPAMDMIKDLELLQKQAAKYIRDNKLGNQFSNAVGSVHELISWGVSNSAFQNEVLAKIDMTAAPIQAKLKNKVFNGLNVFVRAIAGLLFHTKNLAVQQKLTTGLEVLVQNTGALFAEVAASNQTELDANGIAIYSQAMPSPNDYTTMDLFDSITPSPVHIAISPAFEAQLRGVLTDITLKINDKIGSLKESIMKQQTLSPADTYAKAISEGDLGFSVKTRRSNASIREQEAFVMDQVEAVVRAAIGERDGSGTASMAYTELAKLYKETRARLSPKDFFDGVWDDRTVAEEKEATDLHDFIFTMEKTNGNYSDYLSRFAAFGLAHEGFNKLLEFATKQDVLPEARTVLQRLQNLVSTMIEHIGGFVTNTRGGQRANAKLTILVNQLVSIEAKKRTEIAQKQKKKSLIEGDPALSAIAVVKQKLDAFGKTPFFRESKNVYLKAGGTALSMWAGDRVDLLMDGVQKIRNKKFKDAPGAAMKILMDVRGTAWSFSQSLLMAKANENERLHIKTQVALNALSAFKDAGRNLTLEMQAAVSAVILRTGAHVLIDHYTTVDMENMLADNTVLAAAIKTQEDKLKGNKKQKGFFIEQAKALGYYMTTGHAVNEDVLLNASNIANMLGQNSAKLADSDIASVTETVDILATLYAFEYGSSVHTANALAVLKSENARTDGNGIVPLLYLHRRLEQEARERIFGTNESLMIKGYTPETFNPNIDLKAEHVANGGQDLIDAGYQEGPMIPNDPNDPDQAQKRMYINPNGGMAHYLSGIFSLKGERAKGSITHSSNDNPFTIDGQNTLATIQAIRTAKQAGVQAIGTNPHFDPRKVKATHMVALRNSAGEITDYRYMMRESTKDNLLERNNSFSELLGTLSSSTYDKESAVIQNRKAIQLNFDQYNDDFTENGDAYIRVGAYSTDPEMREIYRLLSPQTKKDIKEIWGKEGMMIRNDLLDINFGYRKMSFASVWGIDPQDRNAAQKMAVAITERVLSTYGRTMALRSPEAAKKYANYDKRAANIVRRNGRIWQEMVKEVKDFIVIKSGVVTLGNITANAFLLGIEGIGPKEQALSGYVAYKGITKYKADHAALTQLQLQRDSGYVVGSPSELNRQVIELEDALERNPVRHLVEAGLMPTIVEDLAGNENDYSYKSALTKSMDSALSKVSPRVVGVGKALYMPHDSSVYKGLHHAAQVSDFVARYTLYEHLVNRKTNPLSAEEAIQRAAESFILYDTPMYKGLQYTDDMGITPFMKYFIRVQRVIYRLAKEHPTRFVAAMMINQYMDAIPTILDSAALSHIGNNPIHLGALELPSAMSSSAYLQPFSMFK